MYIFELLVKWINPNKKYERKNSYDPFAEDVQEDDTCEHIFLPLDSSEEMFACTKCGLVVKREELKDKNIFKKKIV